MALQFETMTAAGEFGGVCELPILDLRRVIQDEVLRSIPRFLGRWENGTTMKILLDDNWAEVEASDNCDFVTVSRLLQDCTVVVPNQKRISVGFENVDYEQLLLEFCESQGITTFPTLFRADGTFDRGAEYAGPFVRFLLAELRGPVMKRHREKAWHGDQDDDNAIEGILPQLDNGPMQASGAIGCDLYKPVKLDWATLVGAAAAAQPKALIDAAHDTIQIHGQDFSGNAGLNMTEFMVLWLERLMEYELAAWQGEEMMFELWTGTGQTTCIANLAACMQPCDGCVNPMSDPNIRERAAEFRRDKVIWLYPYDNISIRIRTSPQLTNKMILVPKTIGGRPLIGWVFRDQQREQAILSGALPWYGQQAGLPANNPPLYPDRGEIMEPNSLFEQRAFSLNVQRNGNCVDVWINSTSAIVLFALHLWLYFDNVSCTGLVPAEIVDEGIPVAVTACAAVGGDASQLDVTAAALETIFGTLNGTASAGQVYAVTFNDGVSVRLATVVSYTTATDVLRLEFGADILCTDAAGTAAFGPATVRRHSY